MRLWYRGWSDQGNRENGTRIKSSREGIPRCLELSHWCKKRGPDDTYRALFFILSSNLAYLFLQLLPGQGGLGVTGETTVEVTGAPLATMF